MTRRGGTLLVHLGDDGRKALPTRVYHVSLGADLHFDCLVHTSGAVLSDPSPTLSQINRLVRPLTPGVLCGDSH